MGNDVYGSSRPARRLLAGLLFLTGACALVYQTVWLRELRLVFGAATLATAAVLGVFMGGLGLGSAWLGRRAERTDNLLRFYALLEAGVAITALLTPYILNGVRALYLRTGGVLALGSGLATLLQLLLSVVVLLLPCFLMGGTLPTAVKCVETDDDPQRGSAGMLYGVNGLGAFVGVVLSTFWSFEALGTRGTLRAAVVVNLLVAGIAWFVASRKPAVQVASRAKTRSGSAASEARGPMPSRPAAPPAFVYVAAFVTGFGFFLIELVWYRMSAPLLGGTTYIFGVILALALAGIGVGGLIYRSWLAPNEGRASLAFFALVASAQAFWVIVPYALGDRVAVFAYHAGQLHVLGFAGLVGGWTLVAGLLVFLPSVFSGIQFPLLVSLLGRGRTNVGLQVGYTYAANTCGAIAGSLLGGFVLVPALTAPGCWRFVVGLTLALAAVALVVDRARGSRRAIGAALLLKVASVGLMLAPLGPTAVWRHTPTGYGRLASLPETPGRLRAYFNKCRAQTHREFEGLESSVGLSEGNGYSLLVNGKSDGAALGDAPTQVMLGLVGAALHPQARSACVVGLGTGSTAGWLADVPGMERVDVVEIEPAMRVLAREAFAPVNRDVTHKSNVRILLGDAREALLARGEAYDLIVSEPSNPYRAGLSSFYTTEFYEAARRRLKPGGLFCQWVQGYEIDTESIRRVYATIAHSFPYVETWVTQPQDFLLIGHLEEPAYTFDQLRTRLGAAPFAEALLRSWHVDTLEGFLARHYAQPAFAQDIARQYGSLNTDDSNLLEYGFARALHRRGTFAPPDIMRLAKAQKLDIPVRLMGHVDPAILLEERLLMFAMAGEAFEIPPEATGERRARAEAIAASIQGSYPTVLRRWVGGAASEMARVMLAEAAGHAATPDQARPLIAAIEPDWPAEARLAAARVAWRHAALSAATNHMQHALTALRAHPWIRERVVTDGLALAVDIGRASPAAAAGFFQALERPFAVAAVDTPRLKARLGLAAFLSPRDQVAAVDAFGMHIPWERKFLEQRLQAYQAANDPRVTLAQKDLNAFLAESGATFIDSFQAPAQR